MEALVHRSTLVAAVLVVASLVACASVGPNPQLSSTNPYAPLATLRAETAADLMLPGATLLHDVGAEGFMNITGWQAAFYGHVVGTQASRDDVFAYYQHELLRLGWTKAHNPILSTVETDGWGWCKPRLYYRLTIVDPKQYDRVGVTGGAQYRAVYDARLQGVTESCPTL